MLSGTLVLQQLEPMNKKIISRTFYLTILAILTVPIIWASYWYNKSAPTTSAHIQMVLYLLPMICIAIRVWFGQVNHLVFAIFICMLTYLEALTYSERTHGGWLYLLLLLPLIWLFGAYTFFSILKFLGSENKIKGSGGH